MNTMLVYSILNDVFIYILIGFFNVLMALLVFDVSVCVCVTYIHIHRDIQTVVGGQMTHLSLLWV